MRKQMNAVLTSCTALVDGVALTSQRPATAYTAPPSAAPTDQPPVLIIRQFANVLSHQPVQIACLDEGGQAGFAKLLVGIASGSMIP
ncbi:hypothetical protein [Desulfonatronum thiosulfatophilum]|uniref:hypothetical protein n=1 Tax=Desulfonatronum thiosulfatophilum TaxID=617002 RepID=UPI0011146D3B|nr:hypothetical protein [Desulfonatronum thiosulfatophilum]